MLLLNSERVPVLLLTLLMAQQKQLPVYASLPFCYIAALFCSSFRCLTPTVLPAGYLSCEVMVMSLYVIALAPF